MRYTEEVEKSAKTKRAEIQIYRPGMMRRGVDITAEAPAKPQNTVPTNDTRKRTSYGNSPRIHQDSTSEKFTSPCTYSSRNRIRSRISFLPSSQAPNGRRGSQNIPYAHDARQNQRAPPRQNPAFGHDDRCLTSRNPANNTRRSMDVPRHRQEPRKWMAPQSRRSEFDEDDRRSNFSVSTRYSERSRNAWKPRGIDIRSDLSGSTPDSVNSSPEFDKEPHIVEVKWEDPELTEEEEEPVVPVKDVQPSSGEPQSLTQLCDLYDKLATEDWSKIMNDDAEEDWQPSAENDEGDENENEPPSDVEDERDPEPEGVPKMTHLSARLASRISFSPANKQAI
ncbi:unnamed protein product, partial [Mesorhabditis spiculigera]